MSKYAKSCLIYSKLLLEVMLSLFFTYFCLLKSLAKEHNRMNLPEADRLTHPPERRGGQAHKDSLVI